MHCASAVPLVVCTVRAERRGDRGGRRNARDRQRPNNKRAVTLSRAGTGRAQSRRAKRLETRHRKPGTGGAPVGPIDRRDGAGTMRRRRRAYPLSDRAPCVCARAPASVCSCVCVCACAGPCLSSSGSCAPPLVCSRYLPRRVYTLRHSGSYTIVSLIFFPPPSPRFSLVFRLFNKYFLLSLFYAAVYYGQNPSKRTP